ncbi:MAG: hypothetical protein AB1724_15310 [Thermodesulfobacteriota bacterium]
MAKNLTPFFATENDLNSLLERVSSKRAIQIIPCGLFDAPEIKPSTEVSKLNPGSNYLVADRNLSVEIRAVPQRKGGEKYAVDQLSNQKTVVLRPGGLVDARCLIAGQIGTTIEETTSLEIYKLFVSELRRQFIKIKSYYVGQEASSLLDKGIRLTANPKSPMTYDLVR